VAPADRIAEQRGEWIVRTLYNSGLADGERISVCMGSRHTFRIGEKQDDSIEFIEIQSKGM